MAVLVVRQKLGLQVWFLKSLTLIARQASQTSPASWDPVSLFWLGSEMPPTELVALC